MNSRSRQSLVGDWDHVLAHTQGLWESLRGQRLFITGGTGFFGIWLLGAFCRANQEFQLGASALVLTRDPESFRARCPSVAEDSAVHLHPGDVTDFVFPAGEFSHFIHAATENNPSRNPLEPTKHFEMNVRGSRRVLEFARHCGARRLLFTSSGAVYGKQPSRLTYLSEDYPGAPMTTDLGSAYGQSKRASEFLCAALARQGTFSVSIARPFAFVGPYLKLDANFAIGNFIRDALRGDPIRIQGDGTPRRSYLYAADLAVWLWTILLRGENGRVYNVGSDQATSIEELARRVVAVAAPGTEVMIAQKANPSQPPARYVPAIERARRELGLEVWVDLDEAIRRTVQWHHRI